MVQRDGGGEKEREDERKRRGWQMKSSEEQKKLTRAVAPVGRRSGSRTGLGINTLPNRSRPSHSTSLKTQSKASGVSRCNGEAERRCVVVSTMPTSPSEGRRYLLFAVVRRPTPKTQLRIE